MENKMTTISIKTSKTEKKVKAELHSQFIEFLGTNIYDGIWVGENSPVPNYNGLRKDVVDALAEIAPPILRWPGGCYADTYHWRNGVGPRESRPTTFNEIFGSNTVDHHQFGTHEFMELCRLIGSKPWINVNMMTGSVSEMVEWAEYCNRDDDTSLARERSANGSATPFNIEYWGIGNESWAGGGTYTPESYANEYRKFTSSFPMFGDLFHPENNKLNLQFIAVGPDGNKPKERVAWTKDFFKALGQCRQPKLHGYDLHFYNWNISDTTDKITNFSEKQWFSVLSGALEIEEVIVEQHKLMKAGIDAFPEIEGPFKSETNCELVIGEWGNWHTFFQENTSALWQQATMRDAITTALTLDIFHRHSDKIKLACVAQTVNVLNSLILTMNEKTLLTPNYYIYDMYKVHRSADIIDCDIQTQSINNDFGREISAVYAFASRKDNLIYLNIINTSYHESKSIKVQLDGATTFEGGRILKGNSPQSHNTIEQPNNVIPERWNNIKKQTDMTWEVEMPAASVSVLTFKLV
jgi:alpha-N-arabinofuranosidase